MKDDGIPGILVVIFVVWLGVTIVAGLMGAFG